MKVNFISIKATESSAYEVVHKSFPKQGENQISLLITETSLGTLQNKEAAEIAAKNFAELQNFSYVSENTSVITSIAFGESGFLAVELQSNGTAIGQGSVIDKISSIAQATNVAKERNLPLVLPK